MKRARRRSASRSSPRRIDLVVLTLRKIVDDLTELAQDLKLVPSSPEATEIQEGYAWAIERASLLLRQAIEIQAAGPSDPGADRAFSLLAKAAQDERILSPMIAGLALIARLAGVPTTVKIPKLPRRGDP